MIYLVLLIAVAAIVFIGFLSKYRTRQTTLFTCVVVSYTVSICFFLLYLCKDAFHLNIFLEYFPLPRHVVLDFYSLGISKLMIISLLNLSCTVFLMCNVLFAVTFPATLRLKVKRIVYLVSGLYCTLQAVAFNPYFYRGLYSFLYPRFFSARQVEDFFLRLSQVSNALNCLILVVCAATIVFVTVQSPKIQLLRLSLLSVSISYILLICSYIFFFNRLPGHLIKYSKAADIVTYRSLSTMSQMDAYQYFPYVVLVFFLLFSGSILYLSLTKRRLDNNNLEVTRNIRAANLSSRLFCHYMKNEILAISAEVEALPVTDGTREAVESIQQRCDAIYNKLDGIHKSIRDNTMSIRQVPVDEPIRSALDYVHTSNRLEGAEVEFSCPREVPNVLVDPVYFEQALIELFYNAGDAMLQAERKKLSVTVNYGMRWVTVEIADTGCGIEKKDLTNIFTPLFSTHAMTKNWGIGLSLTHRIITAFDGRIDVRSEVGRGTTFEILLPATRVRTAEPNRKGM